MKKYRIRKLFKKSIKNIIYKINKKNKLNFLKNSKSLIYTNSKSNILNYEIIECKSRLRFKANFELNKDNFLSDIETFEIVKFLCFLDKSRKIIFELIDSKKEEEEEKEIIGFKTEIQN